jgi:hypothetical protein
MNNSQSSVSDGKRDLLRHTLATIAYRGGKALRDAPPEFGSYRLSERTRTPAEIVAHVGDLLDWALSLARGKHEWQNSQPLAWEEGADRFFSGLRNLDNFLASDEPLGCEPENFFQGPLADALTHIGQIAMLRRLAGAPVRAENYFRAEIALGRVGAAQTQPKIEFD